MTRCIASAVLACLFLLSLPAIAGEIYSNGPINGTSDAWTINFGFIVSNTFTVSAGNSTITGVSFGAWVYPGDVLESAEVSMSSDALGGGTVYFDQVVDFTQSGCSANQYGYNVCVETGAFTGPTLGNGTYWLNLQNAVVNDGDPIYWDENDGIGCTSPGCPSMALGNNCINTPGYQCIGSESFTLTGNNQATVPEPGSMVLFGSGLLSVVGILRRKRQAARRSASGYFIRQHS